MIEVIPSTPTTSYVGAAFYCLWSLFSSFVSWLFNDATMSVMYSPTVDPTGSSTSYTLSIGWVLIGALIFAIVIRFLLAIPRIPLGGGRNNDQQSSSYQNNSKGGSND